MKAPYDDPTFITEYLRYQEKYKTTIRESDKVILQLLTGTTGELLDIGCSSGNLLRFLSNLHPHLKLHGGDISDTSIGLCRKDESLNGIEFKVTDIFRLPTKSFDAIVANAVLYCLDDFDGAIASIAGALKPGGKLIAFDFFHSFEQELAIVETSVHSPGGHPIFMRSYARTEKILEQHQFRQCDFHPFAIPVQLPKGKGLTTHTVESDAGRLQFRGTIFQPWCHLVASK